MERKQTKGKTLNIAFFYYLPPEESGGVATFFQELSKIESQYPQLQFTYITLDKKLLRRIQQGYSLYFWTRVHSPKSTAKSKEKIRFAKSIAELRSWLQGYDCIYATNNFLDVFLLSFLIGAANLPPLIYGFHIPLHYLRPLSIQDRLHNFLYSSRFYRKGLQKAKAFHLLKKSDLLLIPTLSNSSSFTIANPITFEQNTTRERPSKSSKRILWVGRFSKQKGISDLIKIISLFESYYQRTSVKWIVVGEGELENKLQNFVKKHQSVKQLGQISRQKLWSEYNNSDVFISTSHWESLPYAVLEAQMTGLPVIGYDIPGVNDIVINHITGELVNSVEDFVKTIKNCLTSNHFQRKTVQKCMQKKYTTPVLYRKYYQLFKEVVDANQKK